MPRYRIRRLTTGSLYKLIFVGSWIGSIPVFFLFGLLGAFGVELLSWNDEYVVGPSALIAGPMVGLFLSTMLALVVASLTALGHWILSKMNGLQLYCEIDDGGLHRDD